MLAQQRNETPAGAQPGEKAVEGDERRVGRFGLRKLADDRRRHRGENFTRLFSAQPAIEALAPAVHRAGDLARLPKTHRRQAVERLAVAFRAYERKLLLAGRRRRALEQPDIMPLDRAQMRDERGGEFVAAGKAEKAGEAVERGAFGRQGVGLLVRHHLQAMLDAAQEIVSRAEFVARGFIDPAVGGEPRQHGERAAAAQRVVAAAGDQLLRLHEELDLADAAAAELHIMAFDRDLAVAAIGVNALLHLVDIGDGGVIEIFAPHERREFAQQFFAGGEVAGAGARLDQRRALPVLAAAAVIIERGIGRDGDLGRRRIGTQPQIDAEDVAVGGALLHQLDEFARQADEKRRRLEVRGERRRGGIEEHHEIDVAGKIKLMGAHLAHRQHDIAGGDIRMVRVGRQEPAAPGGFVEYMADAPRRALRRRCR